MKIKFVTLAVGIFALLTSCSNNKEEQYNNDALTTKVTFDIKTPMVSRNMPYVPSRFVVEVYEGANASGECKQHVEYGATVKPIVLSKGVMYTVLFWADGGTPATQSVPSSGDYNTTSLKGVVISASNKNPSYEAYYGTKTFTVSSNDQSSGSYSVTLNRAVAQVSFIQGNEDFTADNNTLTVLFPGSYSMNVADGSVVSDNTPFTHTFSAIAKAKANATLGRSYVFAPADDTSLLARLVVTFNSEASKNLDNIPICRNHKTNITSSFSNLYSTTFTVSSSVDDWTNQDLGF